MEEASLVKGLRSVSTELKSIMRKAAEVVFGESSQGPRIGISDERGLIPRG